MMIEKDRICLILYITIFNNLFSYPLILNNYYILSRKRKLNGLFSTIKVLLLMRQFNDNYLRLINIKINYRMLKNKFTISS